MIDTDDVIIEDGTENFGGGYPDTFLGIVVKHLGRVL